MKIRILTAEEQPYIYPAVYEMLTAADKEFVPPLSSRNSSIQQDFSEHTGSNGIAQYSEQLKKQRFAVVYEDGQMIAFVSYIENYTCKEIPPEELPNIYLSTLVVSPAARGKGVTTALYGKLFSEYETVPVFTRTWSANIAHIKILGKYGFKAIKVLKNDRGNGMDTVYFKKAADL